MTVQEAYNRIKTNNFRNKQGFDLQILVECMGFAMEYINYLENIIKDKESKVEDGTVDNEGGKC